MGKQWKKDGKLKIADKKGRLFTRISREIQVAAKVSSDPDSNSRLRSALLWAKSQSMPTKTIQRALEKNSKKEFEEVLYEGFAPFGVGVMILCFTDNKVRTVAEIRSVFKKHSGNMEGSVAWMFNKTGQIELKIKEECDLDREALEVEALDYKSSNDKIYFFCEVKNLSLIEKKLEQRKWNVMSSKIIYKPQQIQTLSQEQEEKIFHLIEDLEKQNDCQEVYYSCELNTED